MNWKLFFGEERYSRLLTYCRDRHLTMSAAVRMAVDKLLKARW